MGGDGCCGEGEGEMLEEEALNWGISMKWNEVKKWTEFSVKTRICCRVNIVGLRFPFLTSSARYDERLIETIKIHFWQWNNAIGGYYIMFED